MPMCVNVNVVRDTFGMYLDTCTVHVCMYDKYNKIVLGMAIHPLFPGGNFGHYDFLIEQYLRHTMRHVGLLRSVTLPCYIKITYVTQISLNEQLVSMVKYLRNQFHVCF